MCPWRKRPASSPLPLAPHREGTEPPLPLKVRQLCEVQAASVQAISIFAFFPNERQPGKYLRLKINHNFIVNEVILDFFPSLFFVEQTLKEFISEKELKAKRRNPHPSPHMHCQCPVDKGFGLKQLEFFTLSYLLLSAVLYLMQIPCSSLTYTEGGALWQRRCRGKSLRRWHSLRNEQLGGIRCAKPYRKRRPKFPQLIGEVEGRTRWQHQVMGW